MFICSQQQIGFILTSCCKFNVIRYVKAIRMARMFAEGREAGAAPFVRYSLGSARGRLSCRSVSTYSKLYGLASDAHRITPPGLEPSRERPYNRWRCVLEGDQLLSMQGLIPSYVGLRPRQSPLAGRGPAKKPSDVQYVRQGPRFPLLGPRRSYRSLVEP